MSEGKKKGRKKQRNKQIIQIIINKKTYDKVQDSSHV